MPPKLYLVRHAQGYHNATRNYDIPDPTLTEKGKAQCRELRNSFQHHDTINLVVTSPLRRTIQTASLSFGPVLARDVRFLAIPEAQEVGDHASDTGLPPNELKKQLEGELFAENELEFDIKKLNLDAVKDGWNAKTGYWAWEREAIMKRAADVRSWLYNRPEEHILFVTHGAFLHFLTEDWSVAEPMNSTAYRNCETRTFVFTPESTATDAHLAETPESKTTRGANMKEDDPHVLIDMQGVMNGGAHANH
jgi:broad specificity phosphatase PhoE